MANKILLADDSITIQKVVNLTFADEGIEVVTVSNGDMAERRMSEVNPDLVLADIFMPGKNGYELCQYVKENPDFQNVPVVLLVGAFEPFDQSEARRVKADAHLTKPFESRTLVDTVRNLIEASKPARQATTATKRLDHRDTFDTKPLDPLAFQPDAFQIADPLDSAFKPQTPDFGFNPREAFGGTAALEDPLSLDDGQNWLRPQPVAAPPTFDQTLSFEQPAVSPFAAPQPSSAFPDEQYPGQGSQDLSFLESTDPFAAEETAAPTPQIETGGAYDDGSFAFVEAPSQTITEPVTGGGSMAAPSNDNPLDDMLVDAPGREKSAPIPDFDISTGEHAATVSSQDFTIESDASFEILNSPVESEEPEPAVASTETSGTSDFAISSTEFGPNGSSSNLGLTDSASFDAAPINLESTFSAVDVDFESETSSSPSKDSGVGFALSTESGFAGESSPERPSEGFQADQGFEITAFTTETERSGSSADPVQFTTSDMWSQPETHFAPVEFDASSAPAEKRWPDEPPPAFEISAPAFDLSAPAFEISAPEFEISAPAFEISSEPPESTSDKGFEPHGESSAGTQFSVPDTGFAFAQPFLEEVEQPSAPPFQGELEIPSPLVTAGSELKEAPIAAASHPTAGHPVEIAAAESLATTASVPQPEILVSAKAEFATEASTAEVFAGNQVTVSKAVIDEIVRRVVSEITESVVKEIAWEVVPDAVERVIEKMTRESVVRR